jgi:hypothetical protein
MTYKIEHTRYAKRIAVWQLDHLLNIQADAQPVHEPEYPDVSGLRSEHYRLDVGQWTPDTLDSPTEEASE